jgi:aminopeptidase N
VDSINRSVAARIAGAFTQWSQLDKKRQELIKAELKRIVAVEGISENLYEVASKSS